MSSFKFIDLFAGIGGMRLGCEAVCGVCVMSSVIDPDAQKTYELNFKKKPLGDITKISVKAIPDHDLLLAGFPCQPFSIAGKMKGLEDKRANLFFEIIRILKSKKPSFFYWKMLRA